VFGFFEIQVRVNRGIVTIENIPVRSMATDIQAIFETSRINKYIFNTAGSRKVSFNEFFALEVYFILEKLINTRRRYYYTNIRILTEIKQKLKANTWLRNIDVDAPDRLDFDQLGQLILKPLPKQQEFLDLYNKTVTKYGLNGMLLAAAVGAGKTMTSLYVAACVKATKIIVVCPKPTIYRVWMETAKTAYKEPQSHWCYDSGKPYNFEKIAIFHYEALDKAIEMINDLKSERVTVILDESHNLNDIKALRTQRFIDLCKELNAQDVLLVSGTPIKAMASESIPLFRAIDPLFTQDTMERFKKIYAGQTSKATEILAHRLNLVSFKVEKSELNLDKPIFEDIKVKIPNGDQYTLENIGVEITAYAKERIAYFQENRFHYKEVYEKCLAEALKVLTDPKKSRRDIMEEENLYKQYREKVIAIMRAHETGLLYKVTEEMMFCNNYEKNKVMPNLGSKADREAFKEAKTVVKYLKLKVQGECLGRILGRRRIEAHVDMVPYIDIAAIANSTEKKTVVFTSYAEVIQALEQHEVKSGLSPISVFGKATSNLSNIVRDFAINPSINPLNATYASLSTGVPLIMADTMVIINAPFRDYILQQTIGRINRIGMTTQPRVFTCVLDTGDKVNISSRSVDILKWSQQEIEKILNIESPYKLGDAANDTMDTVPALEELSLYPQDYVSCLEIVKPHTPFFNHW